MQKHFYCYEQYELFENVKTSKSACSQVMELTLS